MTQPLVVVEHLRVERDGLPVVEDVGFQLDDGTDTALVGPNGAGKSSLVRALIGLLPHQAGQVWLLGEPLAAGGRLPPAVRRQIAYLPQAVAPAPNFPLAVSEFVALGWDPPGRPGAAVARALERVDAGPLADRSLAELSGGERQRVLLAFCLVQPRRLLLLDEASSGLDPRAGEQFHALLQQLRQAEGWTILQVSHDLEMVRRSCDRVLCLNRRLRCSGTPAEALAPARLQDLYGPGFVPYHHHHHP